ncbi:MAG: hypothetical protein OEW05_07430 [Candidatus Aminicenantes bacterium]|nr:hypothetical protein [Candidatus Aminicenantes bacterium]
MMKRSLAVLSSAVLLFTSVVTAAAASGPRRPSFRLSLYGLSALSSYGQSGDVFSSEVIFSLSVRPPASAGTTGYEYGLDLRTAGYPSAEERKPRVSIYEAYAGGRLVGGHLVFRLGQLWLNELGALGALGGGLVEARVPGPTVLGQVRLGVFGGLEPKILTAGYVPKVKKFGGYIALEGTGTRRHVAGYVNLRNGDLVERSVLVVNNYVPVGNVFHLYQAAEYDLTGPGGKGSGGLNYFFANARFSPVPAVEFYGTFHRGRSIDTRLITDNLIRNKPIKPGDLEGFLFESTGGRITLRPWTGIQVYAGYGQDRANIGESRRNRWTFGFYGANLFKTGLDLNVSDWRMKSPGGSAYDSWYVSLGRTFGRTIYLESFYSSSVSVLRFSGQDGLWVETYPKSRRFGVSSVLNVWRTASVLIDAERTTGDAYSEYRILAGLTFRF